MICLTRNAGRVTETMYHSIKSGWTSPPDHEPFIKIQVPRSTSIFIIIFLTDPSYPNQKKPKSLQDRIQRMGLIHRKWKKIKLESNYTRTPKANTKPESMTVMSTSLGHVWCIPLWSFLSPPALRSHHELVHSTGAGSPRTGTQPTQNFAQVPPCPNIK